MKRREGADMDMNVHTPRSRALGMHLILVLVVCLLASQVLLAHEGVLAPTESATPGAATISPTPC